MYQDTTLYIKKDLLIKLNCAAEELNISRSRLVRMLLFKYMDSNRPENNVFKKLKYQKKAKGEYTSESLCLRADAYECWCDVRKVYKISAS